MEYENHARVGGIITVVMACLFGFILAMQIIFFEKSRRRYRRRLDEGYYFVEDNWMRHRSYLRAIHPSNIDLTNGIARVINPALILD